MSHPYYQSIQSCFHQIFVYFIWCKSYKNHEKPIISTIHSEKQITPASHIIKIDDYIKTEHKLYVPVNRSYNFDDNDDEYEIV